MTLTLISQNFGYELGQDDRGHIKLADFGLCTGLKRAHTTEFYRQVRPSDAEPSDFINTTNSSRVRQDYWQVKTQS